MGTNHAAHSTGPPAGIEHPDGRHGTGQDLGHSEYHAASGAGGDRSHDKHAGHDPEMFRRLFWWNLLLAIPVLVFSDQIQVWFGYSIDGDWAAWPAPVFGTIIYFWGGQPFLKGGLSEIRDRRPGMMLLISLAITVAYVASLASSLGWGDLDFWWELAALIVVMLLGHWQEMKAIGQAQGALAALAELLPDAAERVTGDGVEDVSIGDLAVGDVVLVRPGGRVPADGEIVDGEAEFDESMITGESRSVHRGEGDHVVAGTVSTDSSVRVRIDAVGDDTALAGIHRLVADAQIVAVAGASPRRPRRGGAVLRRAGRRCVDVLVWTASVSRRRASIRIDHRAGDRLPACARSGDPAGDRDLDCGGGASGNPREGPPGPRADAHCRRRAVRQDRHPDSRQPRRGRCRSDRRARRRRRAGARRRGRGGERAPGRAGDRRGGRRPQA